MREGGRSCLVVQLTTNLTSERRVSSFFIWFCEPPEKRQHRWARTGPVPALADRIMYVRGLGSRNAPDCFVLCMAPTAGPFTPSRRASWLHVTVVVATGRGGIFKEGPAGMRTRSTTGMLIVLPPYSYIASSK